MTFLRTAMPLRQVDSLAPGGPADVSKKVQPGDRLIEINGKSIKGLDARSGHDPYAPCRPTRSSSRACLCCMWSDLQIYAVCAQKTLPTAHTAYTHIVRMLFLAFARMATQR